MYGAKNSCKACASDRKKKCYLTPKIRDLGVIAWTLEREHFLPPPLPPSLPLVHHLFYTSWYEALGTAFLIGSSLYFRCKGCNYFVFSLQCGRILGRRNLVRVRNVVVAAGHLWFYDSGRLGRVEIVTLTVGARAKEGKGEGEERILLSLGSFNMALSTANCALKENACTAGYFIFNLLS